MGLFDWFDNEGSDDPKFQAPEIDSNRYNYGGPGGAEGAAARARGTGDYSRNKNDQYTTQQHDMYNRGVSRLDQGQESRGAQQMMQQRMAERALGWHGSIAQQQADRQMAQLGRLGDAQRASLARAVEDQNRAAAAQQASAAAGARGPAALALAQQNAAGNVAAAQQGIGRGQTHAMANIAERQAMAAQGISEAAQVNAAQEQLDAERAAFGAASGIRQGDQSGAGIAFGAGAQSGQLGVAQGQLGLGYSGLEHSIQNAQMGANMAHEAQRSGNTLGAMGINAGVGGQNASMAQQNFWGALGAAGSGVQGGISSGLFSDEQAKVPLTGMPEVGALPGRDHHRMPTQYYDEHAEYAAERKRLAERDSVQNEYTQDNAASIARSDAAGSPMNARIAGRFTGMGDDELKERNVGDAAGLGEQFVAGAAAEGTKIVRKGDKKKSGIAAVAGGVADSINGKKDEKRGEEKPQGVFGGIGAAAGNVAAHVPGYRGSFYRPMDSDEAAKIPSFGPVGQSLSAGYGPADTATELAPGGGMDVMATLKKAAHVPTRVNTSIGTGVDLGAGPYVASGMMGKVPFGSGMSGKLPGVIGSGMMGKLPRSDEQAKQPTGVVPMMDPPEGQLHIGSDGLARIARPAAADDSASGVPQASFTGPSKVEFRGVPDRSAPPDSKVRKAKKRKETPEELSAQADQMMAGIQRDTEAAKRAQPAVGGGDMASANRALQGYPYAYKDSMRPADQAPGELNVGPMAQQMAMNPITRTAVTRDPQTGMLALKPDKMMKVMASGQASLQKQVDAQSRTIARLMKKKGGK